MTLTFPLLIGAIFFPKKKFLTLFNFSDFLHFFSFENFITNHILSLLAKVKDKKVASVFYYIHGFLFLSYSLFWSTQPALGLKEESISEKRGKEQGFSSLTVTDAICDCDFFPVLSRSTFFSEPDFSDKVLVVLKGYFFLCFCIVFNHTSSINHDFSKTLFT